MSLLPTECEFCFCQTNALPSNFPYNMVLKRLFILIFCVFKEHEILKLTKEGETVSLRKMPTSSRKKQQEPVPGKCGIKEHL